MKLKCIGGPSDGKFVEVAKHHLDARVRDPQKPDEAGSYQTMRVPNPRQIGDLPSTTIYTRRVLREVVNGSIQELHYLAPYGVNDLEAIRHLFEAL